MLTDTATTVHTFPTAPDLTRGRSLADPKVEALAQMFPEIDQEVLALFLSHNCNDVEKAVVAILDSSPAQETADMSPEQIDAQIARLMQLEQDEVMARAVHQALQKELKEEDARTTQAARAAGSSSPPAGGERSVGQVAANAGKFAATASASAKAYLLQRLQRARAARQGSSSSASTSRLLESGDGAAYDMAPLSSRLINAQGVSPIVSEYAPPAVVTQTSATPAVAPPAVPVVAPSPPNDPFPAAVTPAATTPAATTPGAVTPGAMTPGSSTGSLGEASQEKRYSSRMERARSSNSMRRAVITPTASAPDTTGPPPNLMDASVTPLVAAVPEGELI